MHLTKLSIVASALTAVMNVDLCFAFMNPIIVGHHSITEGSYRYHINSLKMAEENIDEEDAPAIETTVKVNDNGNNLTNRFTYGLNALMGEFDPATKEIDNENSDGMLLNAMLNFPTSYAFNVVGKTYGDDEKASEYSKIVEEIVRKNSGSEDLECVMKPRGKNFTKIVIEVTVESSSMITNIYDELAALDQTVMRF
jgi:putative lipoic acid-binding regulatory protein